jgi:DNA-binding MarR family transcriptional regulator
MNKEETQIKGSKSPAWEHVYIYKKIKEKARMGPYIRPKQLLLELKMVSKVPKTLHYPILKQMEEEGLIKRMNHQKYEISEEQKNEKLKQLNERLKELEEVGRRNRMLNAMEECGLITKKTGTKFRILDSDCDKKLELMGNYTFW